MQSRALHPLCSDRRHWDDFGLQWVPRWSLVPRKSTQTATWQGIWSRRVWRVQQSGHSPQCAVGEARGHAKVAAQHDLRAVAQPNGVPKSKLRR